MKNALFLFYFFIFFTANAQTSESEISKIQSLKKSLLSSKSDSSKIELLIQWDELIYSSDSELDKKINEKIIDICLKDKNKSKSYFEFQYAHSLNNLSLIAIEKSDMYEALNLLLESYKIAKKQKIKTLESNILNNIGLVYRSIGSNKKALEYYLRSSKLINDSLHDANTFNNIGLCYSDMNDIENAFKYFHISLKFSKLTNNFLNEANTLCNIADIYFNQKKYSEAKIKYEKAHKIFETLNNNQGFSYSCNKLGICYYNLKDFSNSIKFSEISYEISKKNKLVENLKESSKNLYHSYKKTNQLNKAIFYLEEYVRYFKNSQTESVNNKIIKKQFEIEFEQKKIRTNLNFEKKIEISNEKEKKQKLISYFIILTLIVAVFFLFFVYKRYKISRHQNHIIALQKNEVEAQKHLVEEKNKSITDSITYAKRIQSAILPQAKIVKEYFKDSFILYKPKDIVAGDFYWFEVIDDLIFFATADCTGHGVPGAMVSVVCNNALNRSVKEFALKNPADILDKTREIVIAEFEKSDEDVKDGMDISLCVINLNSTILHWSGAHNPLWILRNSEIIEYKADKQPIGKFAYAKDFTKHEIQLTKNDEIYIFTDGFQDQFGGAKGKKFKTSQMRELLLALNQKTMEEKRTEIDLSFETWKGDLEQVDDVCLIGVKI